MKRTLLVLCSSSVVAFALSVALDRVAGHVLVNRGYFKALPPSISVRYDTSEFDVTATISAQGLRNEMVQIPKPEGVYRMLALGDSMTFGWGVRLEESWPKLVEASLLGEGKRVEVVNAGMPGTDPTQHRRACRMYAERFDVDALLLGYYTDEPYALVARKNKQIPLLRRVALSIWPTLSRIRHPLIDESGIAALGTNVTIVESGIWRLEVREFLQGNPARLLAVDPAIRNDFLLGRINPALVTIAEQDPRYFSVFLDERRAAVLKEAAQELKRFKKYCTSDLPTLVVLLPASAYVDESYHLGLSQLGYALTPEVATVDIDRLLLPLVEDAGMKVVSLLTPFRRDGCPRCFYPLDSHLTVRGNQRVADAILPAVRSLVDGE